METKNKEHVSSLWFERTFEFNLGSEQFDHLLQRLKVFPSQLQQVISSASTPIPMVTASKKWSVHENIGHLFVLERLWFSRFEEIKDGKKQMMLADLNNTATTTSGFNDLPIAHIHTSFEEARKKTIAWLEAINDEDLHKQSIHPRLNKPMNIIDLMYFVAEHDAHHLHAIHSYLKHTIE